jgi:hypothetical protein
LTASLLQKSQPSCKSFKIFSILLLLALKFFATHKIFLKMDLEKKNFKIFGSIFC